MHELCNPCSALANAYDLTIEADAKAYIEWFRLAQRKINGKWTTISVGYMGHFAAGNLTKDGKYTNVKSISVTKASVTLKKGKTSTIKATATPIKSGKDLMTKGHAAKFRYLSTNTAVATVSSDGKITAVGKGTCKVYVVGVNGVYKAISVTVE